MVQLTQFNDAFREEVKDGIATATMVWSMEPITMPRAARPKKIHRAGNRDTGGSLGLDSGNPEVI